MKKALTTLVAIVGLAFGQSLMADAAEFTVTANDAMQFSVKKLEVEAGQPVELTLKNVGQLPKQAMGHNFVVLTRGSDVGAFGNAAVAFANNEYIPNSGDMADKVIAHTKMLGPDESDTISFTLEEPGSYPFLCSFPGHWALMQGTIVVK